MDKPPSRCPAPNSDHANNTGELNLSPQNHGPALSILNSNEKVLQPRHGLYDRFFTNGWGWELLAWLVAAVSLLALIAIFAIFSNKPLGDLNSKLAPNTIVSVLSQIGQTAVLVPVTSCLCRFCSVTSFSELFAACVTRLRIGIREDVQSVDDEKTC